MTRLIIPMLVALTVVGTAPSSWAEDGGIDLLSGNKWHTECSSTAPGDALYCLGFILGVREGLNILEGSYFKIDDEYREIPPFCIPNGVSLGQHRDIFKKFLEDHPEKRHERASILFITATREAFCK